MVLFVLKTYPAFPKALEPYLLHKVFLSVLLLAFFLLLNYSVDKSSCHTENKIWTESKDCGVGAAVWWGGAGTCFQRFQTIKHIFKEMASEMLLFLVITDDFHQVQLWFLL